MDKKSKRRVALAIDSTKQAEFAFDCEYIKNISKFITLAKAWTNLNTFMK